MFTFKTDPIKLTQYGIPRKVTEGKDGANKKPQKPVTDRDQSYIKVPLDKDQAGSVELFNMLGQMDKFMTEQKGGMFKNTTLEKFEKIYSRYLKCVREPEEQVSLDGEDAPAATEKKPSKPRMTYAKFKLDLEFPGEKIRTKVFARDDGGVMQDQHVQTLDQLRSVCPWQSTVCLVVQLSKAWFSKSAVPGEPKVRQYGLTFKVKQIEVIERARGSDKQDFDAPLELDDDDDTQTAAPTSTSTSTKPASAPAPTTAAAPKPSSKPPGGPAVDEEEEEEEEGDEEEEDASPPAKPAKGSAPAKPAAKPRK
jgi:hypothetical protein